MANLRIIPPQKKKKIPKITIQGLDCARIDRPHALAVGLFKPLNHLEKRPVFELQYEYTYAKQNLRLGFKWLGVQLDMTDMMVYLAILRIVSEQSRQLTADKLLPDVNKALRDGMKMEPENLEVLSAKTSLYEICVTAGYTDAGKNLERVYNSIHRLQTNRCFVYGEDPETKMLKKRSEMSFGLISHWGMREGEAYVSINPFITRLWNFQMAGAFVDMKAIKGLKSEIAKKLYFWMCAWASSEREQKVTVDRLVFNVWAESDVTPDVLRKRRQRVRDGMKSIGQLPGWNVELVGDTYSIQRPRYE